MGVHPQRGAHVSPARGGAALLAGTAGRCLRGAGAGSQEESRAWLRPSWQPGSAQGLEARAGVPPEETLLISDGHSPFLADAP